MGVSHRYGRKTVLLSGDLNRLVDHYFIKQHRYLFRLKYGLSHIHANGVNLTVFYVQLQIFYSAEGIHGYFRLIDYSFVIQEFSNASYAVSAHFRLTAVGVEYSHFRVSLVGRTYHYKPVGAYAEMSRRYGNRYFFGFFKFSVHTVDIDIVVSYAMHFCEIKFHIKPLSVKNYVDG